MHMGFRVAVVLLIGGAACRAESSVASPLDASVRFPLDASIEASGDRFTGDERQVANGTLPVLHPFDPATAATGRTNLETVTGFELPMLALRNLWVVWGGGNPSEAAYWSAFATRYGFTPRDGGGLPLGLIARGQTAAIQCLACHSHRIAGRSIIGVGNGRLRLNKLHEDLVQLNTLAPRFGFPSVPIPAAFTDAFSDRTGGPGAVDAFGMGMTLAAAHDPSSSVAKRFGFQQAPSWWTLKYRNRSYLDGAGRVGGFRTMLATVLASGESLPQITARDAEFQAINQHLLSLPAPIWPFEPREDAAVSAGREVFRATCSSCHGTYEAPGAHFPDIVADVGTDSVRHSRFSQTEANWLNGTWFAADHPFIDTAGYLAPPLVGVWASAPYLHNGTVPTLRTLLRPAIRPVRWVRVGDDANDYDSTDVGIRFEARPRGGDAIDTSLEGMSNTGHTFGSQLSDPEIDALVAYLTTL